MATDETRQTAKKAAVTKVTVLADAALYRELLAEQGRQQMKAGARVSLSATAASLIRKALKQPRT